MILHLTNITVNQTMSVNQLIIRPNLINELLNEQFESSSAKRKADLSDNIKSLFYKYDGAGYSNIHEKIAEERANLTQNKRLGKRLAKLRDEVAKLGISESSKITAWAADKNIVIPETVDKVDYKKYILKLYDEKIAVNKAETGRLTQVIENFDQTVTQCGAEAKEFNKSNKREYTQWKTEILKEYDGVTSELRSQMAKTDDVEEKTALKSKIKARVTANMFALLSSKLAEQAGSLSPLKNEQYKLRIDKDSISSDMVRFGFTDKHLSHYASGIVVDFTSYVMNHYVRQVFTQDAITNATFKCPPITVEHINLSSFVNGPISDLYRGLLVEQLRNSTVLSATEKASKIYKAVELGVKRQFKTNTLTSKCVFDDKFITVVYRTVVAFIKFAANEIANRVRQDGIKTFQEKIIVNIFALTYGVWGEKPYEVPKKKK